ncbi:hypothetical protein BOV91_09300, partial [Solemya velum gill symbiont]
QPLGQLSVILSIVCSCSMTLRAMQGRAYIRDFVPHPFGASFACGFAVLRSLWLLRQPLGQLSGIRYFLISRIEKPEEFVTPVRFNGCGLSH